MNSKVLKKQKEVLKKLPKKAKENLKNMNSRSRILLEIIQSLENGKYQHMLKWEDRMNRVFSVKFVHMNSKEFQKADYLELFKELDKLSNKYEEYLKDEKYNHNCKVRCKSNLKKLCGDENNKALTLIEKLNKGKSIQLRKYRLNDDGILGVNNPFIVGNMMKRSNVINVYINIPAGVRSPSSASPLVSTLLDTYCTKENGNYVARNTILRDPSMESPARPMMLDTYCATETRNEDVRNAIPQINPLTVYEQEKQLEENVVTLPDRSIENPALLAFVGCSSIEENNNFKPVEKSEFLVQKMEPGMKIQNMVEFHADVEAKNLSHLVPSSPSDLKENLSDSLFEYDVDYKASTHKLLQQDDPWLSSTNTHTLSYNFSESNDYLLFPTEDWYSLENLSSFEAVNESA